MGQTLSALSVTGASLHMKLIGLTSHGDSPPWEDDLDDEHDPFILLLTLLILFGSLFVILLLFSITVAIFRRTDSIRLSDDELVVDVQHDDETPEQLSTREDAYLEGLLINSQAAATEGYLRAKQWSSQHPLGSVPTDITLLQSLAIQEKGVSAWSFEPNYEDNPSVLASARTELSFLPDGVGMSPQEGGAACVQSNLPVPRYNNVYYFEVKMFNLPPQTEVAVGLTPKPYPHFRFPGLQPLSVGYFSDGTKCHNHPWNRVSYGHTYAQGDVVGVGYQPRGGTVFFTHNGRRLRDAFCGLSRGNFFPAIAANGPAEIHVNFGQAGFLYIEANVRRLGFAPMIGTLPPPPPYGQVRGSVLIETGDGPVVPQTEAYDAHSTASTSTHAVPPSTVWTGFTGGPRHSVISEIEENERTQDSTVSSPSRLVPHLAPPDMIPRIRRMPPPAPVQLDLSVSPPSPPSSDFTPATGPAPPAARSNVESPTQPNRPPWLSSPNDHLPSRIPSTPPPYTSRPSSPGQPGATTPSTLAPNPSLRSSTPSCSRLAHHSTDTPTRDEEAEVSPSPSAPEQGGPDREDTWRSISFRTGVSHLLPTTLASGPPSGATLDPSQATIDSADDTEIDEDDDAILAAGEPAPTVVAHNGSWSRGGRSSRSRSQQRMPKTLGPDLEAQGDDCGSLDPSTP